MRIHIKSLDEESQARIIEDYKRLRKFSSVAKKWRIDARTIGDFIKTHGNGLIPSPTNVTPEIEDVIVELHSKKIRLYKIQKIVGIPYKKILNIIKSRGLELVGNRWYEYNESFFDTIDSEEKAYWLGFIYADGGLYTDGGKMNTLTVKLSEKDSSHLNKLKISLGATNPIKFRTTVSHFPDGSTGLFKSAMLRFTSKSIFNAVCGHGCSPNKSLTLKFPSEKTLPIQLTNHFVRGYFDGDGSVSITTKNNQIQFNMLGSKAFLKDVQEILVKTCGLSYTKISKPSKIHSMSYGGNLNCDAIRDYLYKDATIYLDRKRNIFYRTRV